MMSDDADDEDADGAAITPTCFSFSRRRGHRQRPANPQLHQATPSPLGTRESPLALRLAVQALCVFRQHRPRALGFAVPLLRHKELLCHVQGVQEVTGTILAPEVKKLRQRDVVTSNDVPLPALVTLEK